MNEAGEIVCGPHGRIYCQQCSEDLRKQLGIEKEVEAEDTALRDKIRAIQDAMAEKQKG